MKWAQQFALWKELCLKYPELKRFGYAYLVVGFFGYAVFFFVTVGPMVDWLGPVWAGLVLAPVYVALDELAKHLIVAPQIKTFMEAANRR